MLCCGKSLVLFNPGRVEVGQKQAGYFGGATIGGVARQSRIHRVQVGNSANCPKWTKTIVSVDSVIKLVQSLLSNAGMSVAQFVLGLVCRLAMSEIGLRFIISLLWSAYANHNSTSFGYESHEADRVPNRQMGRFLSREFTKLAR